MRHKLNNIDEVKKIGTCSICGPVKLNSRNPKGKTDKSRWACGNKKVDYMRFKRLGLAIDTYKETQSRTTKCEICSKTAQENKKALSVDHCHKSGRFRGMLCSKCNLAIGLLNDDISTLKKAIKYLKKYESLQV